MNEHPNELTLENSIKEALMELRVSGNSLSENLEKVLARSASGMPDNSPRELLRRELQLVYQDITGYEPPADVLRTVPAEACQVYGVMPLDMTGGILKVAMVDPVDVDVLSDLHLITGMAILPITADRNAVEGMISRYYNKRGNRSGPASYSVRDSQAGKHHISTGLNRSGETPVIRTVNEIISDAISSSASDIHFEPFEREMRVRFRQDGILKVHRTINSRSMAEVISRIKVMATLDIAEKRRPQDGRIRVESRDKAVDIRVSTLPTDHGEKIVMRILDKGAVALDLATLGMDKKDLSTLETTIKLPFGMILVTGPTGSGKTTTLYSALTTIKSPELNISTIEDPIEYKLDGIIQTAVKKEINLTFANTLRTLLRQDPNVIMVGEIRDEETAQMAIRAALTGHLVFSTLHTNDAPSAISRLLDMGMEPFLAASSLSLIMAQRLVRKICPHCKKEAAFDVKILRSLGLEPETAYMKGKGCQRCGFTGYAGRIGLFEMMNVTEEIRQLITSRANASRIRHQAVKQGMVTLRQDGINKVKAGVTTPEEVIRETA